MTTNRVRTHYMQSNVITCSERFRYAGYSFYSFQTLFLKSWQHNNARKHTNACRRLMHFPLHFTDISSAKRNMSPNYHQVTTFIVRSCLSFFELGSFKTYGVLIQELTKRADLSFTQLGLILATQRVVSYLLGRYVHGVSSNSMVCIYDIQKAIGSLCESKTCLECPQLCLLVLFSYIGM